MITVNEYFEGHLKSLGAEWNGCPFTTGVVLPGTYELSTTKEEHLTVTVGILEVRLPGNDWHAVDCGHTAIVPAGVKFGLRTEGVCSYLCWYK